MKKGVTTLLKKRLRHRCFSVNFVKFLRTLFLQNTSGQLLLLIEIEKRTKDCCNCFQNDFRVYLLWNFSTFFWYKLVYFAKY